MTNIILCGYGSGGWNHKGRPTVKSCFSLNAKALKQFIGVPIGTDGTINWQGGSKVSFKIVQNNAVQISWTYKESKENFSQLIIYQWERHKRTFGGSQLYLVCNNCTCLRTSLYLYRYSFQCRVCHKLKYRSQREGESWRLRLMLEKLAKKLGTVYEWGDTTPYEKPKGMHETTYLKLCKRFTSYSERYNYLDRVYIMKHFAGEI